ncbi:MAG TPA: hypothetical protein PKX05_02040 [bacterium]|nr:hypothetical protein [bacterium]
MNPTQVSDFFIRCVKKHKIPHAFIIHGGTSKQRYDVSVTAAKILQCDKSPDICEICYHCKTISSNIHPDVLRIQPEKRNLSIDEVRAIKQNLYIKPYLARYKLFIIETDWMQAPAANSLLKILEEPPEYGILLIVARNNKNFLPTIVSRTINLRINPAIENPVQDKEIIEQVVKIIKSANKKDWKSFFNTAAGISKNVSREEFEDVFETIILIARKKLLHSAGIEENLEFPYPAGIINSIQPGQISELLDKRIYLKFNVNTRLILERIILELV